MQGFAETVACAHTVHQKANTVYIVDKDLCRAFQHESEPAHGFSGPAEVLAPLETCLLGLEQLQRPVDIGVAHVLEQGRAAQDIVLFHRYYLELAFTLYVAAAT